MGEDFFVYIVFLVVVLVVIGLPVGVWFFSRRHDQARLERHLKEMGAQLSWMELDFPGSLAFLRQISDRPDRYIVRYRDARGCEIRRWCRVIHGDPCFGSTLQITPFGPLERDDEAEFLRRENEQFREDIRKLGGEA